MGMLRVWLRRFTLIAVVAVSAATLAVTPALADPGPDPSPECALWERRVYAMTTDGGLVEHKYCLDVTRVVSRWTSSRVVATEGWADTSAVFWSGERYGDGAFYRVSASLGRLYWSRDLSSWQQVSKGSTTDWRAFTSLVSPEPGVIYGTDKSGAVRQWAHYGWQDGTGTVTDSRVVAMLPKASRLLGQTDDGFVGLDGTNTDAVASTWSVRFIRGPVRITVPHTVALSEQVVPFDLGNRYPTSAFALTNAGTLAVLIPRGCSTPDRTWDLSEEIGDGYRQVFAGGYVRNGAGPVEWQCV
jgi:hypothetical protein